MTLPKTSGSPHVLYYFMWPSDKKVWRPLVWSTHKARNLSSSARTFRCWLLWWRNAQDVRVHLIKCFPLQRSARTAKWTVLTGREDAQEKVQLPAGTEELAPFRDERPPVTHDKRSHTPCRTIWG